MAASTGQFLVHVPHQGVLPSALQPGDLGATLNAGLIHQRYAGLPLTESRTRGDKKQAPDREQLIAALIRTFQEQRAEGAIRLQEANARLDRHQGGGWVQVHVDKALTSSLALGLGYDHPLENGLLFHHTLGVPYLPATSLKGLLRAWIEALTGHELADKLLGCAPQSESTGGSIGLLTVLDALPLSWPKLTGDLINCHLPAYYSNSAIGDWPNPGAVPREAPRPAVFLAVEPGTSFRFRLAARKELANLDKALQVLAEALALLGMGAKTSAGYGRVGHFAADDYTDPTTLLREVTVAAMPVKHPTVFLSHHHSDKALVDELATALTRRGMVPWLDQDNISVGESLSAVIEAAMNGSIAVAAVLSGASLASVWVDQELRQAMALERDADQPRAHILPLLNGVTARELYSDPTGRFQAWFAGDRLDRLSIRADGDVDSLADDIASAVGKRLRLAEAETIQIICDARGDGRMVGLPSVHDPELRALVFRPHRGQRTAPLALVDDAWDRWRDDMSRGLNLLLGSGRPRKVRLSLRAQYAIAVWLGARFDRQQGATLEIDDFMDPILRKGADHRHNVEPRPVEILDESGGDTVTAVIYNGQATSPLASGATTWHAEHRDGPLVACSYADLLDKNGYFAQDFDVTLWANQVVADLCALRPRHLRLVLGCPVWAAVSLGQLLTRIEVPHLSVLEWDATDHRYGVCRIR